MLLRQLVSDFAALGVGGQRLFVLDWWGLPGAQAAVAAVNWLLLLASCRKSAHVAMAMASTVGWGVIQGIFAAALIDYEPGIRTSGHPRHQRSLDIKGICLQLLRTEVPSFLRTCMHSSRQYSSRMHLGWNLN
jgi:hypothetical protein